MRLLYLRKQAASPMVAIYIANLFISLHYFLVIYINSPFISEYTGEDRVGTLYLVGSVFGALLFAYFVFLLKRLGNVRFITILIALEALTLLSFIFVDNTAILLPIFMLHLAVGPVIYLNLDIFLEQFTKKEGHTGSTRGLFLSMMNIAQVLSPFLVGLLLVSDEYWKVYALSTGFLLLALAIITDRLRTFADPPYSHRRLRQMGKFLLRQKDFYDVFLAQFLLRFFYAWMVIYMPLYLFRHIGLTWSEIGIVFTIMLLPFLLLEYPLGRLTDTRGEKEMMTIGFIILASAVFLIPFITVSSVALWAALLFITRVGASFAEISSESYFFKHVDGKNATIISTFRLTRPLAYILAAAVATFSLFFMPISWSFFVLSAAMLLGIRYALKLKDTR